MPNKQQQAKQLQDNPLLGEVFAELRAGYIEAWQTSQEPAERERYWHKCRALDDVKTDILDKIQGEGLNYEDKAPIA